MCNAVFWFEELLVVMIPVFATKHAEERNVKEVVEGACMVSLNMQ